MTEDEFLAAFEACSLEEFHHRDYIIVAYLYSRRHTLVEAVVKVLSGLQALAAAWGAPTDDLEKGYHETMTQAWGVGLPEDACLRLWRERKQLCDEHPDLMQKQCLDRFYARERLFSWEANEVRRT